MSHSSIKSYTVSVIYFFLSLWVFGYFDGGDQKFYREFYEGVGGYSLRDGFDFYINTLGTAEPVYFLVVYLFSIFIEKDIFFSILNSIFIYYIYKFLLEKKVSYWIQIFLALNFYLLVLLFSAERLKLSLLFLLLSMGRSTAISAIFQLLAFFTHVQSLLLIVQPYFFKFFISGRKYLTSAKGLAIVFLLVVVLFGVLLIMKEHILGKLQYYNGDLRSMLKPFIFMIFSIICSKEYKLISFFQSLIFVVFSYFFGEERVVIFSYIIFMYYGLQYKNGNNIYVILSSLYFFYKGLIFIQNVFYFGDGFDPRTYLQ